MNTTPKQTNDSFEKQLFSMTTIIESTITKDKNHYTSQGSGFYYNQQSPADPQKVGPQWYSIDDYWLVTNRHVVLPIIDGIECVPDNLKFCFREIIDGKVEWKPIMLTREQLLQSLKLHRQSNVDVALINIKPFVQLITSEIVKQDGHSTIMLPTTLSNLHLPENQPITIDVTSDVIVASYPNGFYDTMNKFPIVKSGIVASAFNLPFQGLPMFQIDAQLFPGSSGGLVISKPTNIAMIDGTLKMSSTKQFVLLGVYSGEFKWYEDVNIGGKAVRMGNSYGLGNVWYSYLISEIIADGIDYNE